MEGNMVWGHTMNSGISSKYTDFKFFTIITFGKHTDQVHITISIILARFRWIKPFFPTDARIKFSQAFVFPHLDYCSCIWGSAAEKSCQNDI